MQRSNSKGWTCWSWPPGVKHHRQEGDWSFYGAVRQKQNKNLHLPNRTSESVPLKPIYFCRCPNCSLSHHEVFIIQTAALQTTSWPRYRTPSEPQLLLQTDLGMISEFKDSDLTCVTCCPHLRQLSTAAALTPPLSVVAPARSPDAQFLPLLVQEELHPEELGGCRRRRMIWGQSRTVPVPQLGPPSGWFYHHGPRRQRLQMEEKKRADRIFLLITGHKNKNKVKKVSTPSH